MGIVPYTDVDSDTLWVVLETTCESILTQMKYMELRTFFREPSCSDTWIDNSLRDRTIINEYA